MAQAWTSPRSSTGRRIRPLPASPPCTDRGRRRLRRPAPGLAGLPRRAHPARLPVPALPHRRPLRGARGRGRRHDDPVLAARRRALPGGSGRGDRRLRDQPPPRAWLRRIGDGRLQGPALPGAPVHRRARLRASGDLLALWVVVAQFIYDATLSTWRSPPPSASSCAMVRDTPEGWRLILFGNAAGLLFAVIVLALTVVSFPLLLDRDVGPDVAVRTSLRAVSTNPVPMAVWGLIVAAVAGAGQPAAVHRPRGGDAGARPRHLAPLPQGRGG